MSLYDEAAVALIAEGAAGKDGVLYNIKPEEKLKATELITEGGFENNNVDSNWSISLGATGALSVSNNEAVFSGASGDNSVLFQNDVLEVGKTYKVSLTIDIREGSVKIGTGGTGQSNAISDGGNITTQGKHNHSFYYTVVETAESDERFVIARGSSPYDFTVDNVSVKEVEQKPLDFTFTRGSNLTATRVAPSGYIEKGRENLLKYSNEFDNSDWEGHAVGSTLIDTITGGQSGYDGSSNAFLLNKDSSDLFKRREQIITETAGVATFSVYAKAGTASSITLRGGSDDTQNVQNGNDDAADFNLANGTSSTINNSVTSSMEAITGKAGDTDRWYRCSVVFKDPTQLVQIYVNFNSASTGTVFVQNAQLENGLVATDYIESHSTTGKAGILEDSPRFDYTGGGCPHLLMEPTRANLFQHSEYFAGTFNPLRVTFEENNAKSPEGVENAVFLQETSDTNTHGFQFIDFDIEDGEFYSLSFFVKAKGREKFFCQFSEDTVLKMNVTVDLSGTPSAVDNKAGHTGSEEIIDYGDGWYRVEINGKEGLADDATRNINFFFIEDASGSTTTYAGDTTKGLLFYGIQIEKGHYCTSYIPNHGTSAGVTRNDDVTNTVDFGEYMDGEDITWYVELAKNDQLIRDGSTTGIRLSTTDLNASSVKFYRSYAGAPDGIRTVVFFSDDENDNDPASHIITEAGPVKVIVRRVKSTGEFTIFYDGAQKYQAFAPANYGKLKTLKIDGEKQPLFINNMFLFDRALTDDECIALTT